MTETGAVHGGVKLAISLGNNLVAQSGWQCHDTLFFGLGLEELGAGFIGGEGHTDDEDE
jgi:hypothetical protein